MKHSTKVLIPIFSLLVLSFLNSPAKADTISEELLIDDLNSCVDAGQEVDAQDELIKKCANLYGAYQRALGMYNLQKALLDLALNSGSMTQEEYDTALAALQAVVDRFRDAWIKCRNEVIIRACLHIIF